MNNRIEPVSIGGVMVGDEYPTVFMAEIGTFFNKNIELAIKYLNAAVGAGAQVFKTEILHSPDVCLRNTGTVARYKHASGESVEDYRALVERKVVPLEDYGRLFKLCRKLGTPFVCSVYDREGIDFLVHEGGAAIKFARDNINNIPLIRYAAKTGLPVIFDAGVVYLEELARAVRTAREAGVAGVIVNHHPGANPAPPEVHNLRIMKTYKTVLKVPVGLACHYRGDEILYVSVGAGVNIIEKGVVDDPDREEQDLVSAASLSELRHIVRKIRNCWLALGKDTPQVTEPRDQTSWKGMVAKKNIQKGEKLTLENVGFAWPPKGISVSFWDLVENKETARDITRNTSIEWADVVM